MHVKMHSHICTRAEIKATVMFHKSVSYSNKALNPHQIQIQLLSNIMHELLK